MRVTIAILLSIALLAAGCSGGEAADTSPLPPKDNQSRVESAAKSVASSDMTPEQKQAAASYLQQGAANAERIKSSAGSAAK